MAVIKTGNSSHDVDLLAAELTRQQALAGTPTQAQARAADLAYARTCLASSIAKNSGANAALFQEMLAELGVKS